MSTGGQSKVTLEKFSVVGGDWSSRASNIPAITKNRRVRPSPQIERDGQRVYANSGPPGSFIAVAMQFAMVKPTDGDRVFVADVAAERARLGKANLMGFGRRSCTGRRRVAWRRTCSAPCPASERFLR